MREEDDELLLNYLLGCLTPSESEALRSRLENDPQLAKRLRRLQDCLESRGAEEDCPPPGLADKTAETILSPANTAEGAYPKTTRGLSLAEIAAVSLSVLLLAILVAPAVHRSRESARLASCALNLQELAKPLMEFAKDRRTFPRIDPHQNAGMFTIALAEGGYADRRELSLMLDCPASDLSNNATGAVVVYVPTRSELLAANDELLAKLRRYMAGAYAYRLGHLDKGRYIDVDCRPDSRSPLLSDAPVGDPVTSTLYTHGCGQNVLFKDGSIRYVVGCWLPTTSDHIFLNRDGRVAAGQHWCDAVLAPSWASPGLDASQPVRFEIGR